MSIAVRLEALESGQWFEPRRHYDPTLAVRIECGGGRTHQSFKDECDINLLMARYEKQGVLDHLAATEGRYGDFVLTGDYKSMMDQVVQAQEMFMLLPAKLRKRFMNDPQLFYEFATDEANLDEMEKMGLVPKREDTRERVVSNDTGKEKVKEKAAADGAANAGEKPANDAA